MPASHFIIPVTRQRTEFSPLDRRVTVVVTPNYLSFCHLEAPTLLTIMMILVTTQFLAEIEVSSSSLENAIINEN